MALTVAELAFVFGADLKQVDAGFDKVKAEAKSTARTMDSSMTGFWRDEATRTRRAADDYARAGKQSGEKYKSGFLSSTKGMVAGLAAGFGALEAVRFFGDSIDVASDLNETVSKTGVIFGDSADAIAAWAEDSNKNILLTKQQALDAAGTFGIFGKAAGKTGDDLADFSLDLTALAQDFSSFFNARPEDAILAIGAALRGENEPIRQFGVLLDDATLRARALKMGLISTTKDALTPQQKALAAYQEILAQTKDVQGDAIRTQDGFANSTRQMQQEVAELKQEIGERLLPAATGFVHFMRDTGVPVLTSSVSVIGDMAGAVASLPTPVKAAAAAFAILKISSALGWTDATARGVRGVGSAFDTLRLHLMDVSDTYKSSRAGVMEFNGNVGQIVAPAGRATSSLKALKTAGVGVGAGLKAGLGSVVGLLGGPWGIALTAATAGLTFFWQEHQKAKAEVEAFMGTLDAETGALTESSRQWAAKKLLEEGVLDDAKALGLSLESVTDAALNQAGALDSLRDHLNKLIDEGTTTSGSGTFMSETARDAEALLGALNDTNGVVRTSAREQGLLAEAIGDSADATAESADTTASATGTMREYGTSTSRAANAVTRLYNAENKRRLAAVQEKRDELALIETMKAAEKEARQGKKTLDENTKAGRDNWAALLDLADQWNSSKGSVRNAKGAYADMREEFIKVATEMSGNQKKAKHLADTLLTLPKNVPLRFQTDEMKDAIRKAIKLKALMDSINGVEVPLRKGADPVGPYADQAFADGGEVRGHGGPRDDRVLARVSPGEWFTPNGPSQRHRRLLEAINRDDVAGIQRYAGGQIDYSRLGQSVAAAMGGRIAPYMHVDTLRAHDLSDVRRATQQDNTIRAGGGEVWWDQ